MYSQLCAKVSAGLTNISGLAVAACNLFRSNKSFTITEWFVVRWLVKSYVVDMSTDHEMTWWWRNLFVCFFRARFSEELQLRNRQWYCKKNGQQFSMVFAIIDLRNNVKCSNLFSESTRLRLVVAILNLYLSFLWLITVQTMENRCPCFNWPILMKYFFLFFRKTRDMTLQVFSLEDL